MMPERSALVIEDRSERAREIARILEHGGYLVFVARTVEEAERLARDERPNLALLAMARESLDPGRVIKSLKRQRGVAGVPVILILDEFLEDLVASALRAGAVDHLTWPVDAEELLRRAGVHARLKEDESAVAKSLGRYEKHFGLKNVGLFFTTRAGELLECNDALAEMLGYDNKEELLHSNVEETIYLNPEERSRFREAVEKRGVVKDFRVTFRSRTGEPLTILISGQVVRDDEGEVIGYRGENVQLQEPEPHAPKKGLLARLLPHLSGGYHSLFSASELLGHRYEKEERLGMGSFGEVWKVRDMAKDPPEVLVAKIPLSKKFNARFEKEARILISLAGHPGVPEIRKVIEVKGRSVLVQGFVEGKTLFDVIERELSAQEVESVMIQLTDVTAHAHRIGVIHRDIKPGNIMVRPDGTIKLMDFGAAKELRDKTSSDTVIGSRPYMSPEQIMGRSQRRSDVWALGVVMYVLYTGMFPFYHEVEKVLMDMILEVTPSRPSKFNKEIDPEMERVIMKCMEKNPEDRYRDAGALKEELINKFPGYGKVILPLY